MPPTAAQNESGQTTTSTDTTAPTTAVHTEAPATETVEATEGTGESFEVSDANSLTIAVLSSNTGNRMPIKIDTAFIKRHGLTLDDPLSITVSSLKECVWKDWKDELGQRPASANFIKFFHFGQALEDRRPLKETRVSSVHNAIHLVLRPAESGEDDATQRSAKLAFGRSTSYRENGRASCRCVIL